MSNTSSEPPITPAPPGYPAPFSGPVDTPGSGYPLGNAERQLFAAWDRLMVALGHKMPVALNKMTYYRARLDNVVK